MGRDRTAAGAPVGARHFHPYGGHLTVALDLTGAWAETRTMTTTTLIPGAKFLGRNPHGGICGRCSRDLIGNTYLIDLGDDGVVVMGRRCAARTMGWATSRVEMMAVSLLRCAEVERRREIVFEAFPHLRAVWEDTNAAMAAHRAQGFDPIGVPQPLAYSVAQTAWCHDSFWTGGDGWVTYIESCLSDVSA